MVKAILVGNLLDEKMINAGKTLLGHLDKKNILVNAAFWYLQEKGEDWKLIIASQFVRTQGPLYFYKELQNANEEISKTELEVIDLPNITAVPNDDELVCLLKHAIKTGKNKVSGIRFTRNVINGRYIEDAYLYRMT